MALTLAVALPSAASTMAGLVAEACWKFVARMVLMMGSPYAGRTMKP